MLVLVPFALLAQTVKKTSDYPNTATPLNTDLFLVARPGSPGTNLNITWLQMHSNQTFYGTTTFAGDTNNTGNVWDGDQFFNNGNIIMSNGVFVGPIDATNIFGLTYGYDTNQNIEVPDLGDLILLQRPGGTNYNIDWLQAHSNQTFYGTTIFAGGATNSGPNIFAGDQFFYDGNLVLSNGFFVGAMDGLNIVNGTIETNKVNQYAWDAFTMTDTNIVNILISQGAVAQSNTTQVAVSTNLVITTNTTAGVTLYTVGGLTDTNVVNILAAAAAAAATNAGNIVFKDANGLISAGGYAMTTNAVLAGQIDFTRHNVLTNTSSGFTLPVAIANVPTTVEDSVILNVYNSGSPFAVTTDNTTWFTSDNSTTHWVTNTGSFLVVVRPGVSTNLYFSRCQH